MKWPVDAISVAMINKTIYASSYILYLLKDYFATTADTADLKESCITERQPDQPYCYFVVITKNYL